MKLTRASGSLPIALMGLAWMAFVAFVIAWAARKGYTYAGR